MSGHANDDGANRSPHSGGTAATGDPVLDRMLRGGLPRERTVLLTGGPGTGKSTLAMQFLQTGLDAGERCLYVSTEQTPDELRASFAGFDFDLGHDRLAVGTLHAAGDEGRRLRMRSLGGDASIDREEIPFTSENVAEYLSMASPRDRVVVDSVSALRLMIDDRRLFRRGILEVVRTLSDEMGATALLTAGAADQGATGRELQYATHGVLRLRREYVNDDPHRYLVVEKMRGVPHDPRRVEFEFTDAGIRTGPARRSQPPALKTHRHTPVGIDGLDALCGGGLATGAGVLLKHDGRVNLRALFGALIASAVGDGRSIVLSPTARARQADVAAVLDGFGFDLEALIADGRLFVLDFIGSWDADRDAVHAGFDDAAAVIDALGAIDDRIDEGTPTLGLFDADALTTALGADGARTVRYEQEAALDREDLLVHVHDEGVVGDEISDFYVNTAEQVLETWLSDDGLQYVSLRKSPCGFVGTTSLVEYAEGPPYLRVQHPPTDRDNPYASEKRSERESENESEDGG